MKDDSAIAEQLGQDLFSGVRIGERIVLGGEQADRDGTDTELIVLSP